MPVACFIRCDTWEEVREAFRAFCAGEGEFPMGSSLGQGAAGADDAGVSGGREEAVDCQTPGWDTQQIPDTRSAESGEPVSKDAESPKTHCCTDPEPGSNISEVAVESEVPINDDPEKPGNGNTVGRIGADTKQPGPPAHHVVGFSESGEHDRLEDSGTETLETKGVDNEGLSSSHAAFRVEEEENHVIPIGSEYCEDLPCDCCMSKLFVEDPDRADRVQPDVDPGRAVLLQPEPLHPTTSSQGLSWEGGAPMGRGEAQTTHCTFHLAGNEVVAGDSELEAYEKTYWGENGGVGLSKRAARRAREKARKNIVDKSPRAFSGEAAGTQAAPEKASYVEGFRGRSATDSETATAIEKVVPVWQEKLNITDFETETDNSKTTGEQNGNLVVCEGLSRRDMALRLLDLDARQKAERGKISDAEWDAIESEQWQLIRSLDDMR